MQLDFLISNLKRAQQVIVLLIIMVLLLLLSNILLISLAIHDRSHAQTFIVPSRISAPFKLSQLSVDSSYLQQMTLAFLNARLNVTPENIDASHKWLMQFVASSDYNELQLILERESKAVKQGDISSSFYISGYRIDPKNLTVTVHGQLRWWFGEKKMTDSKKTYQLHYAWRDGALKITRFAVKTKKGA